MHQKTRYYRRDHHESYSAFEGSLIWGEQQCPGKNHHHDKHRPRPFHRQFPWGKMIAAKGVDHLSRQDLLGV
jgi:hypothetical protein